MKDRQFHIYLDGQFLSVKPLSSLILSENVPAYRKYVKGMNGNLNHTQCINTTKRRLPKPERRNAMCNALWR